MTETAGGFAMKKYAMIAVVLLMSCASKNIYFAEPTASLTQMKDILYVSAFEDGTLPGGKMAADDQIRSFYMDTITGKIIDTLNTYNRLKIFRPMQIGTRAESVDQLLRENSGRFDCIMIQTVTVYAGSEGTQDFAVAVKGYSRTGNVVFNAKACSDYEVLLLGTPIEAMMAVSERMTGYIQQAFIPDTIKVVKKGYE